MSWHKHPGVRTGDQLTLGERAADKLRNGMGSWGFVFAALAFLAGWMLTGGASIDPMPFILLNLMLSCLAALQGAILLIAAKRSDQISSELAQHDFEVNQEALTQIQANTTLARKSSEHIERIVTHLGLDSGPSTQDGG